MRVLGAVFVTALSLLLAPVASAGDEPAPGGSPGAAATAPADAKDLVKSLGSKESPERLAAAEAAKASQDARLIVPLVKLLHDDLYEVREAAREALAARESDADRKKAAQGLSRELERLAKDPQASGELIATIDVLHDLAQVVTIESLIGFLAHDTDAKIVEAALLAVANVPDAKAVEALIDFSAARGRHNAGHRAAVTAALRYATGERLGNDPDEWRAWWKENAKTFDREAAAARRVEEREKAEKKADRRREREEGGERRPPKR